MLSILVQGYVNQVRRRRSLEPQRNWASADPSSLARL